MDIIKKKKKKKKILHFELSKIIFNWKRIRERARNAKWKKGMNSMGEMGRKQGRNEFLSGTKIGREIIEKDNGCRGKLNVELEGEINFDG